MWVAAKGFYIVNPAPTRGARPSRDVNEVAAWWSTNPNAPVVVMVGDRQQTLPDVTELPVDVGRWLGELIPDRQWPILRGTDIENQPPVDWLVDGLIATRSLTLVYGDSGTFKSFLMMDLALSLGIGRPWHGYELRRGRALYVLAENSPDTSDRVRSWREHHHVDAAEVDWITSPVNLYELGGAADRFITERRLDGGYDLIVFDTLARSITGADENSARDMGIVIDVCSRMQAELGAAVILVHHTGREGKSERGSSRLSTDPDTKLKVSRKGDRIEVVAEKVKQGPSGERVLTLRAQPVGGSLVLVQTTGDKAELSPRDKAVYMALTDEWEPRAAIQTRTAETRSDHDEAYSEGEVRKALRALKGQGLAEDMGDNRDVKYRRTRW